MATDKSSEAHVFEEGYNVASLSRKLILDAETPISLLYRFLDKDEIFLLEGISGSSRHDRFSYLGFEPYMLVTSFQNHTQIKYDDGRVETRSNDVFAVLEELTEEYKSPGLPDQNYHCGLIGFLTYECLQFIEDVTFPQPRELGTPLARFIVPRNLIITDNLDRSVTVIRNVFTEEMQGGEASWYEHEESELEKLIDCVLSPLPESVPLLNISEDDPWEVPFTSNTSAEEFEQGVLVCKEYIKAGDIFQVQLSRRITSKTEADPIELYRHLRHVNPSPFMFYLRFENAHLIGASPELLVKVEDGKVYHRPIAGTRKRRSQTRTEPEIVQELLTDEKEKAEHIMLVDLARNDVGRVCQRGSVEVDELMVIEVYSHVFHMVSNIEGRLKRQAGPVDALRSSFPAGTVTGAPKVRAMEIISELEAVQRELYSGGVVFLDFQGNLKCALTIRSMFLKDGLCHSQAAAGVVFDSVPELEFLETNNKLSACRYVMATTRGRKPLDSLDR